MPYPNFHSARIRDPDAFDHIVVLKTLPNGIMVYGGPLKSDPNGPSTVQAYRFPADKFTVAQAKAWLKEHDIDYIDFEPATGKSSAALDATGKREFYSISDDLSQVELRTDEGGKRSVVGYAAVYDLPVRIHGNVWQQVAPTAFLRALEEKHDVRALLNHDENFVFGRTAADTLQLKSDNVGLWYKIDLADTQSAKDLAVSIARRDITGSSFGCIVIKDQWSNLSSNKRLRTIEDVILLDVSPVTYPMYNDTCASVCSAPLDTNVEESKKNSVADSLTRKLIRAKLQMYRNSIIRSQNNG